MLQYAFGALFSNLSQVFFCILFFILTRICVCVSVGLHEKSGEEEKFLNIFNWTFASSRENTTTKGGNWDYFCGYWSVRYKKKTCGGIAGLNHDKKLTI